MEKVGWIRWIKRRHWDTLNYRVGDFMKRFLIALACLILATSAGSAVATAQAADEPASRDDILLLLRTMRSHDMVHRTMEVQAASIQKLFHDQILKDTGKLPPDFDARFRKAMKDMIDGMPTDEIVQAMIPAYQKHFTHGDIAAMNTFYSSPVGQKVLEELPAVMQDGMQAALPIMAKYLGTAEDKMKRDLEGPPAKTGDGASTQQN
jgi:uncharacterized protein